MGCNTNLIKYVANVFRELTDEQREFFYVEINNPKITNIMKNYAAYNIRPTGISNRQFQQPLNFNPSV